MASRGACKAATRANDNDDDDNYDVAPTSGGDGLMDSPALLRKRAALVNDDDEDVPLTSAGDGVLMTPPTPIRKRAALVNDDDEDVSPTSGGGGEVMAAPVRRGYGSKPVPEDVNDAMDALLQVHLQRVRDSAVPGKDAATQRAEAEAGLARQCAEEQARLQQAQTKLNASQERLKEAERKLALCETHERALDGLFSESNPLNHQLTQLEVDLALALCVAGADERALDGLLAGLIVEPVRRGLGNQSASVAADQDDEMSLDTDDIMVDIKNMIVNDIKAKGASSAADAKREERLARARLCRDQHLLRREAALAQAETQREIALVAARAQLEAATAQLAKVAAEVTVAVQEEKEAVDASAKAWSQVHMTRMRTGTAAQRAEAEVCAARERAEEEESLQQARAKLQDAKKRLWQTERVVEEAALAVTEEKAMQEPIYKSTPPPPPDQEGLLGQRTGGGVDVGGGELSVARQEAKAAKREERLQRARGKLGAQQMRRDVAIAKTEAMEVAGSTAAASGSSFASASTPAPAAQPGLTSRNDGETAASLKQKANFPSTSGRHVSIDIADALPPFETPLPPKKTKVASQLSAQHAWLSHHMECPRSATRIGIAMEQDSTRSADGEEEDNEPGASLAPQSPDRGSSSATARGGAAVPRAVLMITRFARFARI